MPVSVKVAAQKIYLSDTASTKDSITLSSMAAAGARRQTGADKKKLVFKDNPDESRIVMNKNSGKDVMASLQKMREDRKLCDVIIQVRMFVENYFGCLLGLVVCVVVLYPVCSSSPSPHTNMIMISVCISMTCVSTAYKICTYHAWTFQQPCIWYVLT